MDKAELKMKLMRENLAKSTEVLYLMPVDVMNRADLHCAGCRSVRTGMPGVHPVEVATLHNRQGEATHTLRLARCVPSSRLYVSEPQATADEPAVQAAMHLVTVYGERCSHATPRVVQVSHWQPIYPYHVPSGETRQMVCETCGAIWTELWEVDKMKDE